MPAFFFVAGMLYKPSKVTKWMKRLVVPNFIRGAISILAFTLLGSVVSSVGTDGYYGAGMVAAENRIDAEFLTKMRHEHLSDFYRSLDLFVLPSYFEGFRCVFTEAHSCGVPFITCEVQGIDDIISVEDRNKWLCKPKDAKDLAEKIQKAIASILGLQLGTPTISLQVLNEDQDIDTLVKTFVENVNA